jgi:phosphatidylserine/phosphatidylglycerophosphate/cardiolipin synthase-like enzyme
VKRRGQRTASGKLSAAAADPAPAGREPGTDFIRLSRPVPVSLVAGRGHYESVVERVMNAERSVWIATANLKELMVEDHRARPGRRRTMTMGGARSSAYRSVLAVFAEHVARGIEIRILHAGEPSRPFRAELARHPGLAPAASTAGATSLAPGSFEMRLCPRVHFKAVVIDGAEVYLGSANWTGAGLGAKGERRRNFELGVMSRDDLLLDEIQRYFDVLWHGTPCRACRLRHMCPKPLDGA